MKYKNLILRTFYLAIFLVFIVGMYSCSSSKHIETVWINSYQTKGTETKPMSCLQIQKGDSIDNTKWETFYHHIDGFTYEPGYIYNLKISSEKNKKDTSVINYSLESIISKELDPILKLNDIWIIKAINKKDIKEFDGANIFELPNMEIHIIEKKIMGFDGCNYYNAPIQLLGKDLIKFGVGASTKKMCAYTEVPKIFNNELQKVSYYKFEDGLTLLLLDVNRNEILRLSKVD